MSDFETKYITKHRRISMAKSWIRIIGAGAVMLVISHYVNPNTTLDPKLMGLAFGIELLAFVQIVAEFLGIWEEMI